MQFQETFNNFIQSQKVIGFGFQQPTRVKLPNDFYAFPGGYFTVYENGYRVMINGASIGEVAIQEILILNPEGVPIARDSQDLGDIQF
jgi:hypothetical protein